MKRINFLFPALFLFGFPLAYGDDWLTFHYGEAQDENYSISLIDEEGFFSKTYVSWVKVSRTVDKGSCGSNPENKSFLTKEGAAYSFCMSRIGRTPVEEVYKVTIGCDKKTISSITEKSVNFGGYTVNPTLQMGSHPGSFGYALIEHYCNK